MQGTWEPPQIDNPEFKEDKELYKRPPIGYVAFELWQVKAGTIFDNIMLTDSKDEALQFAKDTWGKSIDKEKEMKEQIEVRLSFSIAVSCPSSSRQQYPACLLVL